MDPLREQQLKCSGKYKARRRVVKPCYVGVAEEGMEHGHALGPYSAFGRNRSTAQGCGNTTLTPEL
jgi:hypothetical protein